MEKRKRILKTSLTLAALAATGKGPESRSRHPISPPDSSIRKSLPGGGRQRERSCAQVSMEGIVSLDSDPHPMTDKHSLSNTPC